MHGAGKDRIWATNLAPNAPIFQGTLIVLAAATTGRLVIPITFAQFTEALLVYVLNRPTQTGVPSAGAQLLLQSGLSDQAQFPLLPNCEYLAPGCWVRYPLVGWTKDITLDARGISPQDWTTRRDVTLNVVVYQLDRTVREEWQGQKS